MFKISHANIKEWAANYSGELFDGILCDPPYELGFMGKSWDSSGIAFDTDMWADLFKLLKPGAHLLAFSGSRTYHRMAVAIEDAGFEIRDMIEWVYGSGFPKSLNIGKAVDKIAEKNTELIERKFAFGRHIKEERLKAGITLKQLNETFGYVAGCNWWEAQKESNNRLITWNDWVKLKEIITTLDDKFVDLIEDRPQKWIEREREVIGKTIRGNAGFSNEQVPRPWKETIGEEMPITKGTSEWEGYGTALKPAHEPCVLARKPIEGTVANNVLKHGTGGLNIDGARIEATMGDYEHLGNSGIQDNTNEQIYSRFKNKNQVKPNTLGRFPANLIHDGSDEVEAVFPNNNSRFFYSSKASKSERNAGLEGFEDIKLDIGDDRPSGSFNERFGHNEPLPTKNAHPTVKPLSLTKYLATLIKPPTGGRLLVPFSGSGSEMIGALQAGWEYVEGVELTEEYIPIAEARIRHWLAVQAEEDLKPKQATLL